MRERFVAPEEVDHIDALRLTGMRGFDGSEEDIDGDMDLHVLQLFTDGRTEADLIRSPRAGDKESAGQELVREPVAAEVAFFEYRRAFDLTRDEWLRSRGHEEAIDDARELVAAHEQSRPAQRRAVGDDLTF